MKNKYYHLSKDYERLYQLVKSGVEVICQIRDYQKPKIEVTNLCFCRESKSGAIEFYNNEILYLDILNPTEAGFVDTCKMIRLEWVNNGGFEDIETIPSPGFTNLILRVE